MEPGPPVRALIARPSADAACRTVVLPAALEDEQLAEQVVLARGDQLHADLADHAQRGGVPGKRGRLHRGDAGLRERPVDARAGGLAGEPVAARALLDAVADLGDA